jgi:hypothetical protein
MIENGTPKCDVKAKARAIIASLPVTVRGRQLEKDRGSGFWPEKELERG